MLVHEGRIWQHVVESELQRQKDCLNGTHPWIVLREVDPMALLHDTYQTKTNQEAHDKDALADDKLLPLLIQIAVEILFDDVDEHEEHCDTRYSSNQE